MRAGNYMQVNMCEETDEPSQVKLSDMKHSLYSGTVKINNNECDEQMGLVSKSHERDNRVFHGGSPMSYCTRNKRSYVHLEPTSEYYMQNMLNTMNDESNYIIYQI